MEAWMWLLIIIAIVAIVATVGYVAYVRRRSSQLRDRYGSEYDHVRSKAGTRGAVSRLTAREKRFQKLEIRPLNSEERENFEWTWGAIQARFVDSPRDAVHEADDLVAEVMRTRGYPVDDFEQRAADVSVEHPDVVAHYRAAHEVAISSRRELVETELLRQAMIHYRELFEALLGEDTPTETAREEDLRLERHTIAEPIDLRPEHRSNESRRP